MKYETQSLGIDLIYQPLSLPASEKHKQVQVCYLRD